MIQIFSKWIRKMSPNKLGTPSHAGHSPKIRSLDSGYRSENVGNDAAARPWDQVDQDLLPARPLPRDHDAVEASLGHVQAFDFVLPDVPLQANSGLLGKGDKKQ